VLGDESPDASRFLPITRRGIVPRMLDYDMTDRVAELLDFDLALIDSIVEGRALPNPEEPVVRLPDLRGTAGRIHFVGFDEAGRGALAGPVAVACVHIDLGGSRASPGFDREAVTSILTGLDDSKRLTPRRRESLYEAITCASAWGFGCAAASEIDRYGIGGACRLAARRAYAKLAFEPDVGLFDRGLSLVGKDASAVPPELQLTRGDARSLHIAGASVVAKVGRDAIMDRLGERFPGYGLSKHKGYGTAAHREAIRSLGPSIVHRRSFCTRIERAESQSC
jgi:ribonuclease HII